jgi:hypothetical protein
LEVDVVAVAFDRMEGDAVVTLMDDRMEALTDLVQKL